jgi:hypothetical protein
MSTRSKSRLLALHSNIRLGQNCPTMTNTQAYYRTQSKKVLLYGGLHYKQCRYVMHVFRSKLVCLSKPMKAIDNAKKHYHIICLYYEPVCFIVHALGIDYSLGEFEIVVFSIFFIKCLSLTSSFKAFSFKATIWI